MRLKRDRRAGVDSRRWAEEGGTDSLDGDRLETWIKSIFAVMEHRIRGEGAEGRKRG